jgi:hypothetical protein
MPEWALQAVAFAGAGVGAYVAIRADLAALRVIAEAAADSAGEAHKRIDEWFLKKGV